MSVLHLPVLEPCCCCYCRNCGCDYRYRRGYDSRRRDGASRATIPPVARDDGAEIPSGVGVLDGARRSRRQQKQFPVQEAFLTPWPHCQCQLQRLNESGVVANASLSRPNPAHEWVHGRCRRWGSFTVVRDSKFLIFFFHVNCNVTVN